MPLAAQAVALNSARHCPNKCWGRGVCAAGGVCQCEPGYVGDDCSSLAPCPGDCSGRGQCAHGQCFCDPGWGGVNCSSPLPCPNGCSDQGVCVNGQCYCDPGYSADDCSVAPHVDAVLTISPLTLVVLAVLAVLVGIAAGAGLKAASDQRRRARLIRYIQESDAQAPFVSGELRDAVTSGSGWR